MKFLTVLVAATFLLTLALPAYPERLSAPIAAFLALSALCGVLSLTRRAARHELLALLPLVAAALLALSLGMSRHADTRQAFEDLLPYALFGLGVCTGRATASPRVAIGLVVVAGAFDAGASVLAMPSFDPEVRSTYNYLRITAGLPLLALFAWLFLRDLAHHEGHRAKTSLRVASVVVVVALALCVLLTRSRGMTVALVLGSIVTAYLRRPGAALLALVLLAAGVSLYTSELVTLAKQHLRMSEASTVSGRLREIDHALEAFFAAPFFGQGAGARLTADYGPISYIHNMLAYHLWKFGLVGCGLLTLPFVAFYRELAPVPRRLTAAPLGGATAMTIYLTTSASYKTYYLVWIVGVCLGAALTLLRAHVPSTLPVHAARRGAS